MHWQLETVERRILMAVTASFDAPSGTLTVFGDSLDNTITLSRNAAGNLLVNGGAVAILGGTASVANTALIQVFGQGGNDGITLDQTNGALPRGNLFGGTGNDTLTGGSGNDQLFGQSGNDHLLGKGGNDFLFGGSENDVLTGGDADDQVFGESGNDRMVWNPGDDTDLNEGGADTDTVEVNGGGGAEQFTVTANGTRVRFDRLDPAPFSIDIGTSENLVLNANGGNDSFSATGNLAALIQLTIDAGAGNDTVLGSNGIDLLLGGDGDDFIDGQQGNDVAFMGAGNDVFQWDPGDGSDVVEGQDGTDTMLFNGSAGSEIFEASSNGSRVRFTRNLGNIVMDLNDIEGIDLNTLGGTDTVILNDTSGTGLTQMNVSLAGTIGGSTGDAAADSIIVNGRATPDSIGVAPFGAGAIGIVGLPAFVHVTQVEAANDSLTINPLGGADTVTVDDGANLSALTIDLGTDAAADEVILKASNNGNNINVTDVSGGTDVAGLSTSPVAIRNADATGDAVRIDAGGGFDIVTVNQSGSLGGVRDVRIDAGADGDTITVANTDANGKVTILPSPGNDSVNVNVDGLFSANAVFAGTQRIGNLSAGPNGRASLDAGSDMVLTMSSLNLTSTGRLDLADGNAIIDYSGSSPLASVRSDVASGFAAGAWSGPGIVSSAAAAGSGTGTGVGYAEASDLFGAFPASFKGQSIDDSSILLSHTRYGDADLNGVVNLNDFNRLAANFGKAGRHWSHGDFDYNGNVNLNDFNQLAANFGQSQAPPVLPGATSGSTDESSKEDDERLTR